MTATPETGKPCETCGGSGKQKPPPFREPVYGRAPDCMACMGTGQKDWMAVLQRKVTAAVAGRTSPPAASPDPRPVVLIPNGSIPTPDPRPETPAPDPRAVAGSVWRDRGGEFTLTRRSADGDGWFVEPNGGTGLTDIFDEDMADCTFVRGPAPEAPAPVGCTRTCAIIGCWSRCVDRDSEHEGIFCRCVSHQRIGPGPLRPRAAPETPAPPGPAPTVTGSWNGGLRITLNPSRVETWIAAGRPDPYHVNHGTYSNLREEPHAPPPREGGARLRTHRLLWPLFTVQVADNPESCLWHRGFPKDNAMCDAVTAELARLDGVIADLERERSETRHQRREWDELIAERDAERSRADGHAAEVDRLTKALAEMTRERDDAHRELEAPVLCANCKEHP